MSAKLLERMVEANDLPFERDEVRFVQELIAGEVPPGVAAEGRGFLFEIVANKRNGIDVDKFDYLARDSFHCSMPKPDFARLIIASRVMDGQVAYRHKEAFGLGELFHRRFFMFKTVYCHAVGVAIELMLCDILTLACLPLDLEERMSDIERYTYLNDSVLNEIESSRDPQLRGAQALLRRLRCRDLYKAVGMVGINAQDFDKFKGMPHEEVVAALCDPADGVTREDLVVHTSRIDYGMSTSNPLERVACFRSWDDTHSSKLRVEEVTAVFPNVFQEINCRCYCKTKSKKKAVSRAWDLYCKDILARHFNGAHNEVEMSRQSSLSNTPQSAFKTQEAKPMHLLLDPDLATGGEYVSNTKKIRLDF